MNSKFRLVALTILFVLTVAGFAFAATDGIYQLSEVTSSVTWDGTDAVLPQAPTPDYDAVFGDDTFLTYNLPASFSGFTFYRQPYSQITFDTNGNIWFGYSGYTYSFSLSSAGKGPVISAWNNDLSSYAAGGVFIQHKTNPERVVIEWQAETFTDEGSALLNHFEVVLFPDGKIRIGYNSFSAANAKDYGSGISKDDGTHYLSVTSNYENVPSLSGRYFQFADVSQASSSNLSVVFSGPFPTGTQITLHAEPSQYSLFTGWTNGVCSGTADCPLALNSDTSVMAVFDYDAAHQVQVSGGLTAYYSTVQAAYDAAAHASTIKLWATNYSESLHYSRPITVTLKGGYDSGYNSKVGKTVLNGTLRITDGKIVADGLTLR